jgi:hypothetical protein
MSDVGKITIIAKNIKGNANGQVRYDAKKISNTSGGVFTQNGKGSGVSHNNNTQPKQAVGIKITKLEGPFDDAGKLVKTVKVGEFYTFKATPSRKPIEVEIPSLKWALKPDNKEQYQVNGAGIYNRLIDGKIVIKLRMPAMEEKVKVYAFYNKPSESVSVLCQLKAIKLPIVIDRYKMPGLNQEGTDIADDMTYGKGVKKGSAIYTTAEIQNFIKEYKDKGFITDKHSLFSNKTSNGSKAKYSKEECYSTKYGIISTGFDVRVFNQLSDDALFWDFEETASMYFATGELEGNLKRMIAKFKKNEGGVYEDEVLTKHVKTNKATTKYCQDIDDYIAQKLKEYKGDTELIEDGTIYLGTKKTITADRTKIGKSHFSRPLYSYDNLSNVTGGLTIALNDIWATQVILTDIKFSGEQYTGKYEVTLWDHFGLDLPDMEKKFNIIPSVGEAFVTWFVLQHLRGYKPFITKITFTHNFSGNIKEGSSERIRKRKEEESIKAQKWAEEERMKMLRGPKF